MAAPDGHGTAVGGAALLAALGGVLGPLAAEWALIALAAVIGTLACISEMDTSERTLSGMWWIFVRGLGLSLLFTALIATAAAKALGVSPHEILWPVAGLLAYKQRLVLDLLAKLMPALKKGSP